MMCLRSSLASSSMPQKKMMKPQKSDLIFFMNSGKILGAAVLEKNISSMHGRRNFCVREHQINLKIWIAVSANSIKQILNHVWRVETVWEDAITFGRTQALFMKSFEPGSPNSRRHFV